MIDIKFIRLPVIPPQNKTIGQVISSRFGIRSRRNGPELAAPEFHRAVDIAVVKGSRVYPVAPGKVIKLINDDVCGIGIKLEHTQNNNVFYTQYCHLDTRNAQLQENSVIDVTESTGQPLGTVGDTGTAKGHPHLHFVLQIREGNTVLPADPTILLNAVQRKETTPKQVGGITEVNINKALEARKNFTQVSTSGKTDITPYIASLESFHPFIQYELTRRRAAAETANTYMPYVRLTSLVNVYAKNIQGGSDSQNIKPDDKIAYFPTLGVDGQPDVSFDDIYFPRDGRSIVGYATKKEGDKYIRVPLIVEENVAGIDQANIPIPGIVSVTTERSTTGPMGVRGGLFKANINIRAYSVGQLNTMLKYFLRPATRVVLELGRTSSSEYERQLQPGTTISLGGTQTLFSKFDWQRSIEEVNQQDKLDQMVKGNLGQREFIQKYIYNNFGDYEIFIGYVVNFKIKYTKDNTYEIDLLVHSVQQFEITTKNTGVQTFPSNNPVARADCTSIELAEYFNLDTYWKKNTFAALLRETTNNPTGIFSDYASHVIKLVGDIGNSTSTPGYLITWEYFVNVVLHDPEYGLVSLFQQEDPSGAALQLLRTALIQPIISEEYSTTELNANEVAWNESLRSIDPSTLVIYNQKIQKPLEKEESKTIINNAITWLNITDDDEKKKFENVADVSVWDAITGLTSPVGSFDDLTGKKTSSLTKGIWLNTNAIIDAFTSTDTVSMGITRLLDKMNAAVQGYWNLQPLSSEEMSGIYIIDAGMSKPVEEEDTPISILTPDPIFNPSITVTRDNILGNINTFVKDVTPKMIRPKYRYMFNRKSVRGEDGDIGSELLDISVDSSLPQVIAVQAIAGVGGVGNNATLAAIDIEELKNITIYDTYVKTNTTQLEVCPDDVYGRNVDVRALNLPNIPDEDAVVIRNRLANPDETTESEITTVTNTLIEKWSTDPNIQGETTSEGSFLTGGIATVVNTPSADAIAAQRSKIEQEVALIRKAVTDQVEARRPGYLGLLRDYATSFGMAIGLIEPNVARLTKDLQINKDDYEVHPFNSSNLTKTIVDLTLPGIGGIQLWQSFGVERIPNILERGFYVVTKVAHEFTTDKGWTTKIQGRFRFKPDRTARQRTVTPSGTQPQTTPTQQPAPQTTPTQQPTTQPQTPTQTAPQQVPLEQQSITIWPDDYLLARMNALLSTPTDTAVGVQVPVINDRKIEIRNEIGRRLTTKNYSGQTRLYQALRWAYQRSAPTQ